MLWLCSCSGGAPTGDKTISNPSSAARATGSTGIAGAADGSTADDAGAATNTMPSSEFEELYENIFKKYCIMCHGTGRAGLDMSSLGATYRSLVNVPANPSGVCAKTGLKRVERGDPEKSLLFLKLQTTRAPCGQQMPVGGELRPELQAAIESWIAAGAH